MAPCLLTVTDLQTRRAGLSASAELRLQLYYLYAQRFVTLMLQLSGS